MLIEAVFIFRKFYSYASNHKMQIAFAFSEKNFFFVCGIIRMYLIYREQYRVRMTFALILIAFHSKC